ncbi:MAG: MMPL family transporter [Myxococcaceae bacterium]
MRPLVERDASKLDAEALKAVRDAAVDEPMLLGSLLSRDEQTTAVNVTLRLPRKDPSEVVDATHYARQVVEQVRARHPSLDVRASGMAFVNDAFMETSISDMAVMMPLMLLVMLAAMAFSLRSAWATVAVAAVIAGSAALTMATAGWLGYPLSPTSVAAPMIVLTVAIADGVHIAHAAMAQLRGGKTKAEALVGSLSANLEAVTYTWLTTVVGFLCLNYSDAPPVNHLANMSSVGVTLAWLLSLTLLPALMMLLPVKAPAARAERGGRFFSALAGLVIRRRRWVLAATLLVTVGGAMLASRLEPNDQFIQYFDRKLPFRQDIDFTMQHLSGVYRLEFQLGAAGPGGVTDPAYLERLDAFSTWLSRQPEVQHVFGLNDVIERVHPLLAGGPRRLPSTAAEATEALTMYELSLPAGLDLTDRVNVDHSASRLTVTVRDMSTRQMTDFAGRAEGWLNANAPASMRALATGPVVIFSQLSERNARGMVRGDLLSLVLISLCMVLVLRSLKLGLLSVVPNLIPIVVGYGLWWMFVGQLNVVATIAGSIALGVIVDDTIHFLTHYQAALREGTPPALAMQQTLGEVGPAMVSTAVVLVLGFGVLTLSSFQMTSHLGWLCVLIVGIAPVADLVVAPALVLPWVKAAKTKVIGLAAGKVSVS